MAMDEQQRAVQGIKDPTKRKAAYYKLQREDAQENGDAKTLGSINSKIKDPKKKLPVVDSDAVNKEFLSDVATSTIPVARGLKAVGPLMKGAAKAIPWAEKVGASIVGKGESAIAKAAQNLGKATPVKKALGSAKPALTGGTKAMKNVTPKALSGGTKAASKAAGGAAPKQAVKDKVAALTSSKTSQVALNKSTGKTYGISQADAKAMRMKQGPRPKSSGPTLRKDVASSGRNNMTKAEQNKKDGMPSNFGQFGKKYAPRKKKA